MEHLTTAGRDTAGCPSEQHGSAFTTRPLSLAEAVARVCADVPFSFMLSEFLDTFYGHVKRGDTSAALAAIEVEPPVLADTQLHAYVGGVAEHLARRWALPHIPAWTEKPDRFLARPLFGMASPRIRPLYMVESPLAFRRRLIFVEAVPLRRASMPVSP